MSAKPKLSGADPWWIHQQHETFTLVQGPQPPSILHQPGERTMRFFGPFTSEAEAALTREKLASKTLSSWLARGKAV